MTTPPDAAARDLITTGLGRTLFVEAGAGSGKTRSLVDRVVATVLDPVAPVPLRHIAAVTFTEKAGAELRDRLRTAFESVSTSSTTSATAEDAARQALDELDSAAIGTLHSFARRILSEHPIEAGLPPLIEVFDEVASGVAFDARYAALQMSILDDRSLTPTIVLALAAGLRLRDLRSLASAFTDNWDLIAERVLATPVPALPTVDISGLVAEAHRLADHAAHCTDAEDKLLPGLTAIGAWAHRLAAATDDPTRVAVLVQVPRRGLKLGRKANWAPVDLDQLRADCEALVERARAVRDQVLDATLRTLARRIGAATLADAQVRRTEGRLEFHDLLVLARDLLRSPVHGAAVRTSLHQRYQRLLLDEFQDTDPIQIELALRIAGGPDAHHPQWTDISAPPGRVFVVGDPKQSIYRFRRADIGLYLKAQHHIGEPVVLDTNFRTGASIVGWINSVFGALIQPEEGSQPTYRPLRAVRPDAPSGPPVLVLGPEIHDKGLSATQLRVRESADVVAAVQTALAQRWQVEDAAGGWRDITLPDIAILLPTRTALPQLEAALEAAGIGYHAEASSLVYRASEVRELLAAARVIGDPSDELSLVTALRSRLFGCGDDDLWTWRQAGGGWNILAPAPADAPAGHPVALALEYLRRLHYDSAWLAPSEVLSRIVDDRRLLEVALDEPRSRDTWRRVRFVVDQARAWAESEHAGLRAYLAWVSRQGSETARVAESVLPETDTRTLRIMTIHAAKGMEFPMVIVAGTTTQPPFGARGVSVSWPPDGGYELRLRKDLQTGGYDVARTVDEHMGEHERIRLLYVGCTRARDHLVVSLHRKVREWRDEDRPRTHAELLADAEVPAPALAPPASPSAEPVAAEPVAAPPSWDDWTSVVRRARARSARPGAVSASHLEGSGSVTTTTAVNPVGDPVDAGLAKDPRDLELPPWNKGRYGTAIGRAVHAVLQAVDLSTGEGLAAAVAAQALAEGVTAYQDLVGQLARSALASPVVRRAAVRPHWRETYVGTLVGDQVLEGIVDLLYRDDDGLVVIDYKTDAVPTTAFAARMDFYRPQMAAYALAVQAAVGEPVVRSVLVFLTPTQAYEIVVTDLPAAVSSLATGLPADPR